MRRTKFTAALAVSILALAGCGSSGSDDGDSGSGNGGGGGEGDIKVGLAYDVGGRGDQSFNDSAAAGLDRAADEFSISSDESEAEDGEAEAAREERLRTFAENDYDVVIAVGFAYATAIGAVAPDYPEVEFAVIDDSTNEFDNVTNLVFAEEQGSFLVGAAAALTSESNHVGFVGGVQTPLIEKFEAGYTAGAQAVNPDVQVDVTYLTQPPDFTGFADPARGKTAAQGMFDAGADVVYHAAGGSGGGVFEAAQEAGGRAIGVDSDQYNTADEAVRDVILTSMLKNVDVAVYEFLSDIDAGEDPSGTVTYDLEADGVGYSTSGDFLTPEVIEQLEGFKEQIIAGEIEVPTAP
ncbi:BMP family ABC transporter substrate-binding protein [Nocardioides sp. ChNu-153]|uniref:BMP family lipoprotein n=1 Tax=unclassified Nocardioides TaxID=2615069 RepID=UPI002406D07A|nr:MULTISPECIES: BMP family ABC transporter substrate-binding protein [unclassified Nocardioides]MDF9716795.1 BMP family ABC transporter substrate-binding protein [Nocardioides sp. ChNu-99]MDN7121353.1 BMP family ABC transporter substrate-binding protein [Nocardioides sp. ChNu-153]